MPVTVEAVDAMGRPVPTANMLVQFEIAGPGEIIGLGNGDPNSHEPEKGGARSLFNGLAQVIVQSKVGGNGTLELRAKAAGLTPAVAPIEVREAVPIPAVPVVTASLHLDKWRMSPLFKTKPDPNLAIADNDMNSWTFVTPGRMERMEGGQWVLLRSEKFKSPGGQPCKVLFHGIGGAAEIRLDGKLSATKTNSRKDSVSVSLPGGNQEHTLSVLIETAPNMDIGLAREVTVEPF